MIDGQGPIRRQINPGTYKVVNTIPDWISEIQDTAVKEGLNDDAIDKDFTRLAMRNGDPPLPGATENELMLLARVQGFPGFSER